MAEIRVVNSQGWAQYFQLAKGEDYRIHANDTVNKGGAAWTDTGTQLSTGGVTYDVYTLSGATLYVDQDISNVSLT